MADTFCRLISVDKIMSISKTQFKGEIKDSIQLAVEAIGGWQKYINRGDRVLLKPNFNTADPFPASTSYDFLEAVVQLAHEQGAGQVIVGDSCTFALRARSVMNKLGIFSLEELPRPAKVAVFDEGEWRKKNIPQGKFLKKASLPAVLDEVDRVILLPCLKTHFIARYTGALKLAVGLMKPLERLSFHAGRVEEKIAELNTVTPADLIIMDARKCFVSGGPMNGEAREPNLILAGDSRVEIDLAGVGVIKSFAGNSLEKITPEDLLQIKFARQLGVK